MTRDRSKSARRMLRIVTSRRGALPAALSGTLGLLGTTEIEAKKRKKKHRCKKKEDKQPLCTGRSICVDDPDPHCDDGSTIDSCACYVTAAAGSFCAVSYSPVDDCEECSAETPCIFLCDGRIACGHPCPNPR